MAFQCIMNATIINEQIHSRDFAVFVNLISCTTALSTFYQIISGPYSSLKFFHIPEP